MMRVKRSFSSVIVTGFVLAWIDELGLVESMNSDPKPVETSIARKELLKEVGRFPTRFIDKIECRFFL
jgi:hypothetical protein